MKKTRMQKMLALPLVFVFVAVLMVCALGNSNNAVAAGSLISGLSGSGSMGSGDPGSGSDGSGLPGSGSSGSGLPGSGANGSGLPGSGGNGSGDKTNPTPTPGGNTPSGGSGSGARTGDMRMVSWIVIALLASALVFVFTYRKYRKSRQNG